LTALAAECDKQLLTSRVVKIFKIASGNNKDLIFPGPRQKSININLPSFRKLASSLSIDLFVLSIFQKDIYPLCFVFSLGVETPNEPPRRG